VPDARRLGCLLLLALLALAAWFGWHQYQRLLREEPERFPWTPLSLADPAGPFTRQKIGALADDPQRCEASFDAIGGRHGLAPPRRPVEDARCGYDRALVLRPISDSGLAFAPRGLVTSCPVAAALHLWERDTVQPAALRLLGERIAAIDHYGSYSCRRIGADSEGAYSEHATANAVDIAAFRTSSGRRISVQRDWAASGVEAAFLRDVRDGACTLFATVLSPDYNAAHADHLHFDQARRGGGSWHLCR
jgi:hypothetical protein